MLKANLGPLMHSQIVCAFDNVFSFWDPYYSVTSKGSDRMHALPVRVITKIEANQLNTKHLHTFCVVPQNTTEVSIDQAHPLVTFTQNVKSPQIQ